MKRRMILFCSLVVVGIFAVVLYAQQRSEKEENLQLTSDRVDLETETWVGKRLERTEEDANGEKVYHFLYRVEARQTAKNLPRYVVDHRYSVTSTTQGFQPDDSITLLSTNEESETDSPIWVYDVSYVGSGTRSITFDTSGSGLTPLFTAASGETECSLCHCDLSNCSSHDWCDECNPGCPLNGCSATCTGCSCKCHETCTEDCDCDKSESCPGSGGHDCVVCNPCEYEVCSAACTSEDCSCKCHCDCAQSLCNPRSNKCGCSFCSSSSSTCDCNCHKCGGSKPCLGENCTDEHCLCSCHGKCCKNKCPKNCVGKEDNCDCECHCGCSI